MKKSTLVKGYLFIIGAAVIYGLMPIGAKLIYKEGVNSMTLVFLRNLLSLPFLALATVLTGDNLKLPLKNVGKIMGIGLFGCCFTPLLLFASYEFLPSGAATVFHYVYPAVVLLGSLIFFKEKLHIGQILCFVLCTAGIACFYNPEDGINLTGALLAMGSGVVYAIYVLLLGKVKSLGVSGFKFNFFVSIAACVLLFIACLVTKNLALPTSLAGWIYCVLFAIIINIGAVVLFQQGTMIIGGSRSSILSTLEPITSILAGLVFFQEKITVWSGIGMVLVVLSSLLIAVFDSRKKA